MHGWQFSACDENLINIFLAINTHLVTGFEVKDHYYQHKVAKEITITKKKTKW